MLSEIIICPISNPLEFSPSSWEKILYIPSTFTIKAQLIWSMLSKSELICRDSNLFFPPGFTGLFPFLESLESDFFIIFYKILNLHLVKFSHSKHKISWSNLISKSFSNLSNSKRNSHSRGI